MTLASIPPGFSETARFLTNAGRRADEEFSTSALFSKAPAYDELADMWEECQTPDWDGYGAAPVERDALRNAWLFIEALPLGSPLPSAGAEPDGHVTLEWYRDLRWTLSVSVSPDGMLYFAALFGAEAQRGSAPLFGEVPEGILHLIRRTMSR